MLMVGTEIGPAWNLTIAELADHTDASPTTVLQLDLIISAWGSALSAALTAVLLYLTRNKS